MSCCPVWASRAMLIGSAYVLSEMVMCCLSIAQRALVLEQEPRFASQVRPYDWTALKSGLKWSAT
jgi:hypothetical protein